MFSFSSKGDYKRTEAFLKMMANGDLFQSLDKYGMKGVNALSKATPVDSGLTANSWKYRVIQDPNRPGVEWYNTNVQNGTQIAVLIQYGHGTRNGGYVQGRDYINPAIRPVFDQIVADIWKQVKK